MSAVVIRPRLLRGTVTPPPSKSQAHRLIICAALARGTSTIRNVAFSQDVEATLRCMEVLRASWERLGEGDIRVTGIGGMTPHGPTGEELPRFDCGESGSTLRFLIPIALAVAGGGVFTGRGRLMERPQKPYFDMFEEKGIFYEQKDGVLTLRGRLEPGEFGLPGNVSSQFFTGLLFALPLLGGPSTVIPTTEIESWDYILMSVDALMGAGMAAAEPWAKRNAFSITPFAYTPFDRTVEADWSQAGFWYAARVLGNPVKAEGLNENSTQGDRVAAAYSARLAEPGDVDIDVSQCPDLVPPLAAMAAVRSGTTRIVNAARLRVKESDRLATVTAALNALGARVEEQRDGLTIQGLESLEGSAAIDCCNDHRIAMMAAVAATRCEKPVTLLGADCVKKSYPNFWEHYRMLGGDIDVLVSG